MQPQGGGAPGAIVVQPALSYVGTTYIYYKCFWFWFSIFVFNVFFANLFSFFFFQCTRVHTAKFNFEFISILILGHTDRVWSLDVVGSVLVTGGGDGCFKLWDIMSGQCTRTVTVPEGSAVVGVQIVGDGIYYSAGKQVSTYMVAVSDRIENTEKTTYFCSILNVFFLLSLSFPKHI